MIRLYVLSLKLFNLLGFDVLVFFALHSREFTHRVKSVSMAKFTSQEVDALQKGGNQVRQFGDMHSLWFGSSCAHEIFHPFQRAREIFLRDWDMQRQRLPDSSDVDRIREFIKNVYVDRKYAGGRSSDKPPRDMQSQRNNEDETRRASSYHSYSQSPPYENQYEDWRYGKKPGVLTRKPGSDHGHYEGKIASFVYSPGRSVEQMSEDRFANEGSFGRVSDYSVSSAGDPFRYDARSPSFQKDIGFSSPPIHPGRDILVEDLRRKTANMYSDTNAKRERTASAGSFESFNSNSLSSKSVSLGSLLDNVLEPEQSTVTKLTGTTPFPPLMQSSASPSAVSQDPFNPSFIQPPPSVTAIDLFADITQHPSAKDYETKPTAPSENVGWATFDLPLHTSTSEPKHEPRASITSGNGMSKRNLAPLSSVSNITQWPLAQNSTPYPSAANQWHGSDSEVQTSNDLTTSQSWNAFEDSTVNLSLASFENLPHKSEPKIPAYYTSTSGDHFESSKDFSELGFRRSTIEESAPSLPLNDVIAGSSFPSELPSMGVTLPRPLGQKSTNPFDLPHDSDLESSTMFLNMSSLQAALPNPTLPVAFIGGITETWFPQGSATSYMDAVPSGGLSYRAGQAPTSQLPNIPSPGPVASLGGNPFA
eukprot:TRINITY_DN12661_c0_g1_i4.p1 TRINITY_DN12661_c0_g1~~TRINITY_DN12661_c0_g1_i4.p1  ORF type:complete len:648 (-),score=112.43 TRINITY_DN12661_c0_g1_i4:423-2366(-)